MNKNELKIVSGGQTGVDRGALQAAMDLGLDWGGGAGPRKSKSGGIQKRTRRFLAEVLSGMIQKSCPQSSR